jgi:hypothetical protein
MSHLRVIKKQSASASRISMSSQAHDTWIYHIDQNINQLHPPVFQAQKYDLNSEQYDMNMIC